MQRTLETSLLIFALAFLATAAIIPAQTQTSAPADWPQFRGPERTGISSETGLLLEWPAEGPEVLWKRPLGSGFSGLTISGGRLFTQFGEGGDEILIALDAESGRELWRLRLDRERKDNFGDGPRSTPLVDGGRVYAVSALARFYALDVETGEVVWQHDLKKEFGARVPQWGVAASPIVIGEKLLFNVGGKSDYAVVAFDKATGEVIWHAESDKPGYSAPIEIEVGGVRQVIFFTGTQVMGLAPDDGRTLWKRKWRTSYDVNAATPIFLPPNRLFISSGYDTGAAVFELEAAGGKVGVEEVWASRDMKNQFSSSVLLGETIYGFNNRFLQAVDAATGHVHWRQRGFGHGSLMATADGHLIVLGDGGKLAIAEANPDVWVEKASAQILTGKHWTVPTLYDGRLYVRNESELVCLKIAG